VTLTIHKEENDERELKLTVEVSEDQVEKAMRGKARELAREMRFPGFRKGKVPYRVVVQRLGRDAVRAEAIDDIVQTVFVEALEEAEIEPYGRPTLDDVKPEPLVLEFMVPLPPVVTLGEEYREMRREIEPVILTDEAVDEALEQVQIQHQTVEEVDREVQAGDMVTVSGKGELVAVASEIADEENGEADDQEETAEAAPEMLFDQEQLELLMDSEKLFPGTPFVDNLAGLSAGDETSFGFTFPEDYEEEDLAGREASFELTIIDVKSRDLPPLDDELAKLEGKYESLDEMRSELEKQLQKRAEDQAKEDLIEATIDTLLEDADVQYPPAAVEMEIDEMVESFKNQVARSGWEFEDYLKIQGSTEDSVRDDFSENAEERLSRRLVLRQFMVDEKLRVDTADVEVLIDERTADIDNEELRQQMHDFYLSGSGFDMISNEVLSNKVYERMVAILSGDAPDLDALTEDEEESADSEEE
jgi:trigger factor